MQSVGRSYISLPLVILLVLTGVTFGQKPAKVKEAKLGDTRNVHQCGSLFLAGQPTEEDIAIIKSKGIKRVITLRTAGEVRWDEPKKVKDAGMEFIAVPFRAPDTLTDEVFDRILQLLAESKTTPTVLHCGSANRVGAVWMAHRVLTEGVGVDTALSEAKAIGMRTPAYQAKALAYIKKNEGRERSVRPGINKNFLDPKMKIEQWLGRFEGESREIFSQREDILAAIPIKEGSRIADVGAGTGFFSALFSKRVGKTGWVFAVDISPRFIEHIGQLTQRRNLSNVTPVLSATDNVRLPAHAVDVVFICDTYHHFEYPKTILSSIHSSLARGGKLVVIDFYRIPGKSREFILNHVRAGKDTFRKEIEAAGFKLKSDVKVIGLKENYFLVFEKQ